MSNKFDGPQGKANKIENKNENRIFEHKISM